jgi:hypothetical protein
MIWKERHSDFAHKICVQEGVIKSEYLQVEWKSYTFTLRENARGRFLRITEDAGLYGEKGIRSHHKNILIPGSGLEEFLSMVKEMAKQARELPESQPREQPQAPA